MSRVVEDLSADHFNIYLTRRLEASREIHASYMSSTLDRCSFHLSDSFIDNNHHKDINSLSSFFFIC